MEIIAGDEHSGLINHGMPKERKFGGRDSLAPIRNRNTRHTNNEESRKTGTGG